MGADALAAGGFAHGVRRVARSRRYTTRRARERNDYYKLVDAQGAQVDGHREFDESVDVAMILGIDPKRSTRTCAA